MLNALLDNEFIRCNYDIYREVPLSAIDAIKTENEACREYIENDARFDFVIVQNNKICAIVEVDGAYHRSDEEQRAKDALKDIAVASIDDVFAERRYLRFATDGTSTDEIAQIVAMLQVETDELPELDAECLGKLMKEEKTMAVAKINIIQCNPELFMITKVLSCDDDDCRELLEKGNVYISAGANNLPSEFDDMYTEGDRDGWNSIQVRLNKDMIRETPNGHAIRNLNREDFKYLFRGERNSLIFDCDLSDQYSELSNELSGEYRNLDGINFNNIDGEWDPANVYQNDNLETTFYIAQKRYGYCAVYYKMFSSLFEFIFKNEEDKTDIHVVSVGTGSKTDAISLKYAIEDYKEKIGKTKFIGIDVKSWKENPYFAYLNLDDEYFALPDYNGDAEGQNAGEFYINREKELFENKIKDSVEAFHDEGEKKRKVYLVVFPNMLSEIKPPELVGKLLDSIKTTYEGKETYILTSKNPESIDDDQIAQLVDRCDELIIDYHVDEDSEKNPIHMLKEYIAKTGDGIEGTIAKMIKEINNDNENVRCPINRQRFIRYKIFTI